MIRLSGLTGVLAGSALAALGFGASVVIAPPERVLPPSVEPAGLQMGAPPSDVGDPPTSEQSSAEPDPPRQQTDTALKDVGSANPPKRSESAPSGNQAAPDGLAPGATSDQEPAATAPISATTAPDVPPEDARQPDAPTAVTQKDTAHLPDPAPMPRPSGLPGTPTPPRDTALPETPVAPEPQTGSGAVSPRAADDTSPDAPRLPGQRITGLPGQSSATAPPDAADIVAETPPRTALDRNSNFDGTLTGAPLMAVVLNDPGLPTPLRRSLAALELPVTIALNPMDPSAAQAADIYRDAGKDVLILANGLPNGATATDLDVTFGAWFDALPQAIGVLDLPRGGFARNSNLTEDVLPLIARDGHGLVSFAGGLSRVDSAADRAGVPHAEVFRVLDDEDQSPFTIRRYLDRAVFQASQIGEVIVFGDATNNATMEALEMWRTDGRVDQVSVVPVSAILLTR